MTTEQKELCARVEKDTDNIVELAYIMDNDKPCDIDELIEKCEELIYQHEVIGYYNAMQYLSEHDMSLNESIGIAMEYSTPLESINSELLAALLQQRDMLETLAEYREELEATFFSE
jgi:hypothetical protein